MTRSLKPKKERLRMVQLPVRVPLELKVRAEKKAGSLGVTLSSYIRDVLRRDLRSSWWGQR